MKKYPGIIAALLLLSAILPTACESAPPPVTDYDTFVENLEYAGASVIVTGTTEADKPFAAYYAENYRFLADTDFSGNATEPTPLRQSAAYLQEIEEKAAALSVRSITLRVKGEAVTVHEYASAADADIDAGYADYPDLEMEIPSASGNVTIYRYHYMGGPVYHFKQGGIIVAFADMFERDRTAELSERDLLTLLRRLLGAEFYVLEEIG